MILSAFFFFFFLPSKKAPFYCADIKLIMEKIEMNKLIVLGVALAFAAAIACSGGGYGAPSGSIMQNTTLNKDVSSSTAVGAKTGEACTSAILGIISSGDGGIKAAAAAGGIATVKAVDYRENKLLGSVLVDVCTVAHGD